MKKENVAKWSNPVDYMIPIGKAMMIGHRNNESESTTLKIVLWLRSFIAMFHSISRYRKWGNISIYH